MRKKTFFSKQERGNLTIEAAFIMPIAIMIVVFIMSMTLVYYNEVLTFTYMYGVGCKVLSQNGVSNMEEELRQTLYTQVIGIGEIQKDITKWKNQLVIVYEEEVLLLKDILKGIFPNITQNKIEGKLYIDNLQGVSFIRKCKEKGGR